MNKSTRQIRNCRELRRAIGKGLVDFQLHLCGGAYSRKLITLKADKRFMVANCIDDSIQTLTGRQLYTRSNIGRAMQQGAFLTREASHD